MADTRRVAVATFGRSDFSILRPLCRRLDADPVFDVGLWVGGAHFDPASGRTATEIEESGLPVWARIDGGAYDRTPDATVRMMAAQMTGFAAAAQVRGDTAVEIEGAAREPDLVLILGDRFEAVAAGLAMVPLGVPVGHISGGSITEGAIDDVFRHCLTKIAVAHFCELPQYARRIQRMGEDPRRIFTTGALGLDALVRDRRDFGQLCDAFGFAGLRPGFALATLHPETRHPEQTRPMAEAMVAALARTGRQVVYTYPNADPGSEDVIATIEGAVDSVTSFSVRAFGPDWYPTAMANAGVMIGNSSGGIIEAATFSLPVIDIGDRQRSRTAGPNVIHCGRDIASIARALSEATAPSFTAAASSGNIYGDGRGSERVVRALTSLDWSELREPKCFAEADPTFTGSMMELG